jgi:iron-sulfur cluster repair protein YtfE (RIC family)
MNTSALTKPKSKTPSTAQAPSKSPDATAMLKADHQLVSKLFDEYENARSATSKTQTVARICSELSVHAQLEEEIFYPAVKQALNDTELVPEATVEHATLKDLISQVEGVEPVGEMFNAKIKVLREYVEHHVKEEQDEMFPKAKASKLDLMGLGAQMANRKAEILAQKAG